MDTNYDPNYPHEEFYTNIEKKSDISDSNESDVGMISEI